MPPTSYEQKDWYRAPAYYDLVFDEDTELEATFLEAMHARHGSSRGRSVLEPACGSGRLVLAMARRGWSVTGFDLAPEMLRFAEERLAAAGASARLARGRMESFRYPRRFDLGHCLVSTFKYLLDERKARSHLRCVARALKPGGIYVLGMHLTQYGLTGRQREHWVARHGRTRVVCNIQTWPADRQSRLERVRSRLVVERPGRTERLETTWFFRTYDAAELCSLLSAVPELELAATYDFSYDLSAPRELDDEQLDCVLVLRRRSGRRS